MTTPMARAVREDGRKIHPAHLYEVKRPEESAGPGDVYRLAATNPADQAFRPLAEGGCPMSEAEASGRISASRTPRRRTVKRARSCARHASQVTKKGGGGFGGRSSLRPPAFLTIVAALRPGA